MGTRTGEKGNVFHLFFDFITLMQIHTISLKTQVVQMRWQMFKSLKPQEA